MRLQQTDRRVRTPRRAGYTLFELVVSMTTATIVLGGLSASLFIAGSAMDQGGPARRASADQVLDTFVADVENALAFSERTANAATFTVPDRDGDGRPDTIRYAWSGIVGDPLTYEYNGSTATNIAEDVQNFNLSALPRIIEATVIPPSTGGGSVLFVSGQYADGDGGLGSPTAAEQDRISVMESWGYTVTLINQQANPTEFDVALASADVVYVSGVCNGAVIGTKLNNATVGVVTESYLNAENLGFYSSLTPYTMDNTSIAIMNTSHYITNGFAIGTLGVTTSPQTLKWTTSAYAPGAHRLADVSTGLAYPTLLIFDAGDELADSSAAAGRRCLLPWGESAFDVNALNTDGLTIMQRALEWGTGEGDDFSPLVGHWRLDETSGTVAADSSGNGNDGTVNGTEDWTSAVLNNGLQVDYADGEDYVEIPNSATLENVQEGDYTVTAWFRPDSVPPGVDPDNDADYGIVIKDNYSVGLTYKYDRTFFFSHWLDDTTGVFPSSGATTYPANVYYHVAGVVDRNAGTAKLYVNGSLIDTRNFTPGTAALEKGTNPWRIGIATPGASTWGWAADGIVDDVRIYSRALLDSEIANLVAEAPSIPGVVYREFTDAGRSTNGTNLTINSPSGTADGDLLVAAVATDGNRSSSLSPPSGWTEVYVQSEVNGNVTLGVWWKIAGASEPADYTFTWSGNEKAYGTIMRFTGHNASSPVNDQATALSGAATSSPLSVGVTTTANNCLILRVGGFDDDDVILGDAGVSDHSTITVGESNDGNGSCSVAAAYTMQPTAGSTGSTNFSLNANEEYRTVTIAIEPAAN